MRRHAQHWQQPHKNLGRRPSNCTWSNCRRQLRRRSAATISFRQQMGRVTNDPGWTITQLYRRERSCLPDIRIANAPCSWGTLEFEGLLAAIAQWLHLRSYRGWIVVEQD